MVKAIAARLFFLPSYSPDLNPIAQALRKNQACDAKGYGPNRRVRRNRRRSNSRHHHSAGMRGTIWRMPDTGQAKCETRGRSLVPLPTRCYPFEQAGLAYRDVQSGLTIGKCMLTSACLLWSLPNLGSLCVVRWLNKTGSRRALRPDFLCSNQCRAGTTQRIEHDIAPTATVLDRIGNKSGRFNCRVQRQLLHSPGSETVHPGVVPDVGPVATSLAKAKRVQVSSGSDLENKDEFMLRTVECSHAAIGLVPYTQVL